MKQVTYKLESREAYLKIVDEIKSCKYYQNAKTVLFKVMTSQIPNANIADIYHLMKKFFPNDIIVGISMTGFVTKKMEDSARVSWAARLDEFRKDYAVITCVYFESTKVEVFEYDDAEIDQLSVTAEEINYKLKT